MPLHKKHKQIVPKGLFMFILLWFAMGLLAQQGFGANKPWDRKFVEVFWNNGPGVTSELFDPFAGMSHLEWIGQSPARASDAAWQERFPTIASAENQPRNVLNGSNPHQGVDFAMMEGQLVYPVVDGVVERILGQPERYRIGSLERKEHQTAIRKMMGQVIINQDMNQDGVPDGIYMNYLHVIPDALLREGDMVTTLTPIAVVSPYMPGRYGAHLHMNWSDATNDLTYKTAVFYRHQPAWNYGSAMDVLSNEAWDGDVFYLHGEINNYNNRFVQKRQALKRMEIYYRINEGGWSRTPALMKPVKGSGNLYWYFDFQSIARKGQAVAFVVIGIRGKDDSFPDPDPRNSKRAPYSWAVWPQYYNHPAKSPWNYGNQTVQSYRFVMQ